MFYDHSSNKPPAACKILLMNEYLALFFSLCLVNNIVLVQLLGINPAIVANRAVKTTFAYTVETASILVLAAMINYGLYHGILLPLDITELSLISFMVVIAGLVQALEIVVNRLYPEKARYLGRFLPLIIGNCAILGLSLQLIAADFGFIDMLVATAATAAGFALVMVIMMSLQSRIQWQALPQPMQGAAIQLVNLSLLTLAWMGFVGVAA